MRLTQIYIAGYMLPAGLVFETPDVICEFRTRCSNFVEGPDQIIRDAFINQQEKVVHKSCHIEEGDFLVNDFVTILLKRSLKHGELLQTRK